MKRLFLIPIIILALVACSGPKEEDSTVAFAVETAPLPPHENVANAEVMAHPLREKPAPEVAASAAAIERKFIKTGRIAFDTDDADATRKTIMAAVKAGNAYISRDDEERSSSAVSYTIVVHVPAARFESFIASATKGVTDFREKSISNEDVTARYVDTESRLKTKKEIENRYRALLAKANTVTDMLEIEEKLGEIRTDIEATEVQFRQLNGDIKYSTLHIVFYKSIDSSIPFLTDLADAFKQGVENLRAFTVVLVAVWPFVLLAIGVIMVLNWLRKRRKTPVKKEAAGLSSE